MKRIKPPKVMYALVDKFGALWWGNRHLETCKEAVEFKKEIGHHICKPIVVKYELKGIKNERRSIGLCVFKS